MSELILHSKEFLKAISRCSVGNTFDFFQMLVSKDQVKSGTTNANQSLVSILNFSNDFLDGLSDTDIYELNFISPAASIIPQIKLFSAEDLKCKLSFAKGVSVSKIKVTEKETKTSAVWTLGVPNQSLVFSNNAKLKSFTSFIDLAIDENFTETVESIRKASVATNKVYFTTLTDCLRIEATDYKNDFSGNFSRVVAEQKFDKSYQHLIMCYDAPMFFAVLKQLDLDKEFIAKIIYRTDRKVAALMISCKDESEMYFMPSLVEQYEDNHKVIERLKND